MSKDGRDLFWLTEEQFNRIKPYLPADTRGVPRVDDRRVISGIIHVIRNGLRWKDAAEAYGPHKTLYNRFRRWAEKGVFQRIFAELAGIHANDGTVILDSTHIKAHRTAASLLLKKGGAAASDAPAAD
jgi:transposase